MAKRPRDADADADADAHSAHSAVRMCRVLPRPLPPRPVEQIVAAESAKAGRGASVCATVDDKDSNQWDNVGYSGMHITLLGICGSNIAQ